jgi:WW domain-binding protein 2
VLFFRILLFSDNVIMDFAGQDGAVFKGTKVGRVYLTTHRVIFNNKNSKDTLQSFSAPFISLSDVELEQPVFGANFIRGKIRAQPNGNFTGETKFKLAFKSGGCIDFGQALLRAASMAQRNGGGMVKENEINKITIINIMIFSQQPPPYTPPSNGWYAAPPPSYTPTAGSYGWLPQNSNFGPAPASGVFVKYFSVYLCCP